MNNPSVTLKQNLIECVTTTSMQNEVYVKRYKSYFPLCQTYKPTRAFGMNPKIGGSSPPPPPPPPR